MRKVLSYGILFAAMVFVLCGCTQKQAKAEKIKDLEFTVVSEEGLPDELRSGLEEKKKEEFKATYADKKYLYIAVGYGEQSSGGYSITVNDLYLTENAVYIDTNLCGPTPKEAENKGASYPYVVVKLEYIDRAVVFD